MLIYAFKLYKNKDNFSFSFHPWPWLGCFFPCIVPDIFYCEFYPQSWYVPNIKDNWDTCRNRGNVGDYVLSCMREW